MVTSKTVLPHEMPSKEEVIRALRSEGAKWDGPNTFDLAADMLLGLPVETTAPTWTDKQGRTHVCDLYDSSSSCMACESPDETKVRCLAEPIGGGVGDLPQCEQYPDCPCGGPQPDPTAACRYCLKPYVNGERDCLCHERPEDPNTGGSRSPTPAARCRIHEYDGAFKCFTHDRLWGAVPEPSEPCAGWTQVPREGSL